MLDMETKLKIAAVVLGVKDVTQLRTDIEKTQKATGKPLPDFTSKMRDGAAQTRGVISELGRELAAFVTAGAIINFARSSVQEFAKAESAFRGLEAVANASGFGIGNALKEAEKLSADGLISTAEAAKGLQNLLARGYSLDQAVTTLERLKDSASFNRAAHLNLGEAVVSATEGLKNENSTLVDNAGVTKNVAKMWDDYAASLGTTASNLTQQQKIEAEYQGTMQETQAQLGNSQKALAGFQGQTAQAEQASLKFKQSLGGLLAPTVASLAQAGTSLIENFFKPMVFLAQMAGVRLGQMASAVGRVIEAISNFTFTGLREGIESDAKAAEEMLQEYAKRLNSGELEIASSLKGGEDAQKILDNALKRAAANGVEQKKLTQDRIKDYEKLRDAIRKAWDDSIQAEKNYLAEAKRLRSEANQPSPQSLAGASPQEIAEKEISLRGDLSIEQQRLQRMASQGGSIDDIRAKAEAVQQLAGQYRTLTDVVENDADKADISQRADDAIKQSKLSLAKALEQAAGAEQQRQQDQLKALSDVENVLAALNAPHTVNVVADQAKQALGEVKAAMDAIQDKTITVTVKKIDAANAANFTGVYDSNGNPVYRDPNSGGATGRYATGGLIRGPGTGTSDSILARLSNEEYVIRAAAVRKYGLGFFDAINNMHLPRFANGGIVSRMSVPSLPTARPGTQLQPINITFPNIGTFPFEAKQDVAKEVARALSKAALQYGGLR